MRVRVWAFVLSRASLYVEGVDRCAYCILQQLMSCGCHRLYRYASTEDRGLSWRLTTVVYIRLPSSLQHIGYYVLAVSRSRCNRIPNAILYSVTGGAVYSGA